ncbi:MAG: FAD-dependent oxidoreductase, partial [Candidatus Omnitrophica bacterium]|nr:FAD-dependent oxidoreductase [Candidatus Omnitrophota bacterium]
GLDMEVSRKLETLFKKKSIKVITQAQIQSLDTSGYELILICAGRSVVTQGLGLEKIGIQLQADNIHIDQFSKTNLANIYAAGDCTAKLMLAHFASFQGRLAVENIVQPNSQKLIANSNIPCAIFTDPEIASVGITEDEARKEDLKIEVRRLDFLSSGMARILGKTDGFMKLVIDSGSLKILGVSIIGPQASEIIGFFTLAINNGLSIAQLKRAILPHPSISESIADILK